VVTVSKVVCLNASDRDAVVSVIQDVFGEALAKQCQALWAWRYVDNPFLPAEGAQLVGYQQDGKLRGCLGAIACRIKLGDYVIHGQTIVDWAVSGRGKKRGLLAPSVRMCAAVLALCPVTYGSTSKALTPIWERADPSSPQSAIGDYRLYHRILRPDRVLARRFHVPIPLAWLLAVPYRLLELASAAFLDLYLRSHVCVRRAAVFDEAFDRLWDSVCPGYDNIAVRDSTFLDWRFARAPGADYRILTADGQGGLVGYAVVCVIEEPWYRRGLIVDILTAAEDTGTYKSLVVEAVRLLRRAGVDVITVLEPKKRGLRSVLRRHLFLAWRSGFRFIGRDRENSIPAKHFYDPTRWYFTLADSDLEYGFRCRLERYYAARKEDRNEALR
jgi:hypothetical protein